MRKCYNNTTETTTSVFSPGVGQLTFICIWYTSLFEEAIYYHHRSVVRDIATFFEQPLQCGGCISDFQHGVTT